MPQRSPSRWRKRLLWTAGSVSIVVGGVVLAFVLSPKPGALTVRWVFERDAGKGTAAMQKFAPGGVDVIRDQQYRADDSDAYLDVYFPSGTQAALPTVVWTHGGAWISGNKSNYATYYELLASRGFTVVALDYSVGPEHYYPTAVGQLNDAHAYIVENAERLHVDPSKIFLAGDSAGAQLSSQLATLITSPEYAETVSVKPALRPEQLRGVVLNCGIYDVANMVGGPGIIGWGVDRSLWAYTGERDFLNTEAAKQMSTLNYVTEDFPPVYISGGNGDPLTNKQSKPLADKLTGFGVKVDALFYPADHEPALPHEYQFNLDNADGMTAFERTVDFLSARVD
ncbi:alpha/beta hydrolase [Rhodococcus sp. ARC_M6]|uniref:alpha/beta hydrolase n=1 Tax=Rhodococcus sp. ARC_M6 TaxID=2928852 RepID=UPI001FB40E1B|nr:alpha/beta hydrolase [Rhodococcus sp. ARC_M6]MCJ0907381.1 alpha/beta hydrolase [Rhodococcus sp. ARC_M6]